MALGALVFAAACQEPEAVVVDLDLFARVAPCLPDRSGCAGRLNDAAGDGPVNGCFLIRRTLPDAPIQRLPLHWSDGTLSMADSGASISIPPGVEVEAMLVLLRTAGADVGHCSAVDFDLTCADDPVCLLTLRRPPVRIDPESALDFAEGGACRYGQGQALTRDKEACDGTDDDCDGVIDEETRATGSLCRVGRGACAREGVNVCDARARVERCSAEPGEPAVDESCPANDASCCDGQDDDCDGAVDEGLGCTSCERDRDCALSRDGSQCLGADDGAAGVCAPCDPADHAGCGLDELCCAVGEPGSPGFVARCEPTDSGPDGQCAACGVACQGADTCQGRRCTCGFGAPCLEAERPVCAGGQCVGCGRHADCGADRLCCDGVCRQTDPAIECAACDTPCPVGVANSCLERACACGDGDPCEDDRAICALPARCADRPGAPGCAPEDATCAECAADIDCAARVGDRACVDGQCRNCRDDDDAFCAGNPAWAGIGRAQCLGTECVACDPTDHAGCAEDGDAPICDLETQRCRPCELDAQCVLRPGERDRCVDGRCESCSPPGLGCDPAGEAPICAVSADGAVCRPCVDSDECAALDAGAPSCVGGRCTGCDPVSHAPCPPTALCVDGVCGPCAADADCALRHAEPMLCIDGDCLPCPPGGCVDDLGVECAVDADCAGGICLDDDGLRYCSRACDAPGDCGEAGVCVEVGGRDVCVQAFEPCANDCQCEDGTRCTEVINRPGVATACRPPRPGGLPIGAECDHRLDGQCAVGLCMRRTGRCIGLCCRAEDCPAGTRCVELLFAYEESPICAIACDGDADCPARTPDGPGVDPGPLICRHRALADRSRYLGACDLPNTDNQPAGSHCDGSGLPCAHGICWEWPDLAQEDFYCTQGCAVDENCIEGWNCSPTNFGGIPVNVCMRPEPR